MTEWTARVEWDADTGSSTGSITEPDEDYLDDVTTIVVGHHGALGVRGRRIEATFTVEAGTLRQAITSALAVIDTGARAVGRRVVPAGIEVLDAGEAERRLAEPTIPELVGHREVADMAGVSPQRAAQLTQLDGFPPAVVTVAAGPLRVRSQVETWIARWDRTPGRRPRSA